MTLQRDTKPKSKRDKERLSPDGKWRSFPKVPGLLQYVSTGTFYGRVKVDGKLIRQSLKTSIFTDAKLLLPDFVKDQIKNKLPANAPVTFGDARKLYEAAMDTAHDIHETTKRYKRFCLKTLAKTWPELDGMRLSAIKDTDCKNWSERCSPTINQQYYNNVLGVLRAVLRSAGIADASNPAMKASRLGVPIPKLVLPTPEQFTQVLNAMEDTSAWRSKHAADFVRFLAWSGCRLSEARAVTWADIDMERGVMTVQNAKRRKTKNTAVTRLVPLLPQMKALLHRLKAESSKPKPTDRVCVFAECEKSLTRACAQVGIPKLTHHDLRHFFATRLIESGADVPSVSKLLGHSDGGALILKVYANPTDKHLAEVMEKAKF